MPPDLYTELLDIPEGTRPPDCYTLLGLPLYENAPEAIRKAVLSQTAKVRRHALDPDRERAQRIQEILNEIGRARTILGDPQRKSRHDDLMIARQFGFEVPPESTPAKASKRHRLCPDCGARMEQRQRTCIRCGWDATKHAAEAAGEAAAVAGQAAVDGSTLLSRLRIVAMRALRALESCSPRLRMPAINTVLLSRTGIGVAAAALLGIGVLGLVKFRATMQKPPDGPAAEKTTPGPSVTAKPQSRLGTPIDWADVHPAFRNREPDKRRAALAKFGGTDATEAAVMNALRWLQAQQGKDGAWGKELQPAMTAFALLAFLGHGETIASPDFGDSVERALEWFVKNQETNGFFSGGDGHQYSFVVAAYALSEACALMDLPTVKPVLSKALDVIIKGQNPKGLWNYECVPGDRNDTCYSVWCAQALATAHMAGLGNERIEAAMRRAVPGFKANAHSDGGFGYCEPGTKYAAVGVWSLEMLGVPNDPDIRKALGVAGRETFAWRQNKRSRSRPLYHGYFTTCALAARNDDRWRKWNGQISKALCANQTKPSSPQPAGSGYWASPCPKEAERDPAYSTALCTLMLESYYRYAPGAFPALPEPPPLERPMVSDTPGRAGDGMTVDLKGGVVMEFVWCPPGSFAMGSGEQVHLSAEIQHRVTLTKGFWMGKFEVTQEQWQHIMGSNPSRFREIGLRVPVEHVSWNDCQDFIRRMNDRMRGGGFRLPTEAEWEYACRAGTTTALHNGKDLTSRTGSCPNLNEIAWYSSSTIPNLSKTGPHSSKTTHPVGILEPNSWGLHDMIGNVYEWCEDWFGKYPTVDVTDPLGVQSGSKRCLRGGSWSAQAWCCRSPFRSAMPPATRNSISGFRLVWTAQ